MELSPREVLRQYFGYGSFRPLQEEIIGEVLAGRDTFVLMPTGSGKSLCYQLPALLLDGVTVVISPLIALMKDQVDGLRQNGINAAYLNSTLSPADQEGVYHFLRRKELDILYIAPERLGQPGFLRFLKDEVSVALLAIDEAHCISEWGHDFRPDYRQLGQLKQIFPETPVVALTATATKRVARDIVTQLQLHSPKEFQASFHRNNLTYTIEPKINIEQQLLDFVRTRKEDSGIIYCHSRKRVDEVAAMLRAEGFGALPYHAGLSAEERRVHQERFIRDDVPIVVATIAFGMGIDKPNVRYVIHADLPANIERYYQETGRAGRDGLPSDCVLFYTYGDRMKHEFFIKQKDSEQERDIALWQLGQVIDFAESDQCRIQVLLHYFDEQFSPDQCQAKCDNCKRQQQRGQEGDAGQGGVDQGSIDGTQIAQRILVTVARLNQRFGMAHIAKVLTGSRSKALLQYRHDKLPTYNSISEYSAQTVQFFVRELVRGGYLAVSGGQYPTISLTQRSQDILKQGKQVRLKLPPTMQRWEVATQDAAIDQELLVLLKNLRKELADERGIPPYLIFSDVTLQEMASFFPQTAEQLLGVSGVGEQKFQTYGKQFLDVVTVYCKSHGIQPIPRQQVQVVSKRSKPAKASSTVRETVALFQQGLSVEEIAAQRNLVSGTIVSHLEKAYVEGEEIALEKLVSPEKRAVVGRAFREHGTGALSPIKELLGEGYTYEDLRIVRALLSREGGQR